jgi:hypothetical protein
MSIARYPATRGLPHPHNYTLETLDWTNKKFDYHALHFRSTFFSNFSKCSKFFYTLHKITSLLEACSHQDQTNFFIFFFAKTLKKCFLLLLTAYSTFAKIFYINNQKTSYFRVVAYQSLFIYRKINKNSICLKKS